MNINFEQKRILVTGAGQGIGKALALRLSKYNAQVIALSKTEKNLVELAKIDPKIQTVCVDLCNWDATRKAVEAFLPIDLLVNNAGVVIFEDFLEVKPESFDLIFEVNVKAVLNVSQIVAKNMIMRQIKGSIVNISSQAAQVALEKHCVYCTSKAALDMLTKSMAFELGQYNIRVNSINPTVVLTEMGKAGWSDPQKADKMLQKIPLGRFAEVEEIVDCIVYLLSDRSSMITGVSLPIDGGFLVT